MWYNKIIDEIIQTRPDILFIIDPENLTKYPIIKEKIKEQFKNIIIYENELSLRKELRNQTRLAVIFQNNKNIPYDLYSIHASVEIGIKNIFPLLDNEVVRLYACDDFQKIYKEYENIKDRYESLSKEETIDFIGNIVSAEDMQSISELADLDYENWGKIAGKYGEICSIFCRGNGIRVHKDLIDTRSRRYLISGERKILEQYQNEYSSILQFPNMIGDEYILLLRRDMFAGKNEKGLTHGGISIEEMIVPFVRVKY